MFLCRCFFFLYFEIQLKFSMFLSVFNKQVFMFYGTDFSKTDLPLPRGEHHEWALFHEESPKNNYILCHEDALSLFNHTSTFRQVFHSSAFYDNFQISEFNICTIFRSVVKLFSNSCPFLGLIVLMTALFVFHKYTWISFSFQMFVFPVYL